MSQSTTSGIFDQARKNGLQSCRKLAEIFKKYKSSIYRAKRKIKARSGIPGALAHKLGRVIWAVLTKKKAWDDNI